MSAQSVHAAPSSSGLGHRPFTPVTRVRVPLGSFGWVRGSGFRTSIHSPDPEPEPLLCRPITMPCCWSPSAVPTGPTMSLPFLENVLRGRNVPRERMLEVADHYFHFGGKSPINEQNRQLIAALQAELAAHGPNLPIYWGNRNWHPLLADTLRQMAADGVRHALGLRHQRLQLVLRLPPISRKHRPRAARGRPQRAGRRQAPRLLQPSRLHRADDRARERRVCSRFRQSVAPRHR